VTAGRRIAGGVLALLLALGLAAASAVPLSTHPSPDARIRVAFSARPERLETCRTLTPEELAGVPAHMRRSQVCEGTSARYRLVVAREGRLLHSTTLRGGGLRHDRRLYVLHDVRVPSGPAVIEVRLVRVDAAPVGAALTTARGPAQTDASDSTVAPRDAEERRRRVADEVPPLLVLREAVALAPREVLLVTYDQDARRLRLVRDGTPPR
jgi:hypothetical protein